MQNETDLAAQLVGFLQQFLNVFSELKGKSFYLQGKACVLCALISADDGLHSTRPPHTSIHAHSHHTRRQQVLLVLVALHLSADRRKGWPGKDARPDAVIVAVYLTHADVVGHRLQSLHHRRGRGAETTREGARSTAGHRSCECGEEYKSD